MWDAEATQKQLPLWKLLGGTRRQIPCGVSIGIQDSVDQLLEKIQIELAAGYRRIKIKVKPGWDINVLERIRSRWADITLSCDANSAYTLDQVEHLRKFDQFNLLMIEQPLWNDDIYYHARLQKELRTSICLNESSRSVCAALPSPHETGACRIINVKVGHAPVDSPKRWIPISARLTTSQSGAVACLRLVSDALKTSPSPRWKTSACPATYPRPSATGRKTLSNPKLSFSAGNDHDQRQARNRLSRQRRLD